MTKRMRIMCSLPIIVLKYESTISVLLYRGYINNIPTIFEYVLTTNI